jgi:hypothetical protein
MVAMTGYADTALPSEETDPNIPDTAFFIPKIIICNLLDTE